ncbi:MAG TPA: hypothetical protein VJ770_18785 [Stellaceae bacterium]|nr:hypothetical protein [Stellaceae bacterium]
MMRRTARSDHWRWVSWPFDRLRGDFELPACDEPLQHLARRGGEIGGEKSLGFEFAGGIAYKQPADRHRGLAAVVPHGSGAGDFDQAMGSAIPQGDGVPVPDGGRIVQALGELGQLPSLERRSSAPAAFGWGQSKQVGVEAQPFDKLRRG